MKRILYAVALSLAAFTLTAGVGHEACPLHEKHMKGEAHAQSETHAKGETHTKGEAHAKSGSHSSAKGDAKHGAEVDRRHDGFGMSHDASRHSFRLFDDGGAIELRSVRREDAATVEAIRAHLKTVAEQFERGDFRTPGFVHGSAPDGIETISERNASIDWKYEELPEGGRVRIRTTDAGALAAVHAFLKFQVIEHRTGDTGVVETSR